jgi:hypothetical protein
MRANPLYVSRLLDTNTHIRCLLTDFSKAFDVVDHVVLIEKLAKLGLPFFITDEVVRILSDWVTLNTTLLLQSG